MTLFRYDPLVLERFPTIVGGLVHAQGVSNGPSPPALTGAFRAEQERTLAGLTRPRRVEQAFARAAGAIASRVEGAGLHDTARAYAAALFSDQPRAAAMIH